MAGHGGIRAGQGRKKIAEELGSRQLALAAVIEVYGSPEKAFASMLSSGKEQLIKWAMSHAFGNPIDQVQHSGEVTMQITGMEVISYKKTKDT